ncbi:MAG: hypothetical protein IKX00_02465 [Bacilli bacterium]|nr:hypothetical protein [Bacilli bacterium]
MLLTAIKIFFARICDVSIGTIRTIYTIEEKKFLATLAAFVEVFIWFHVARSAINGEFTPIVPFAYAGGYATGTYVGMLINSLFNKGNKMLTVITSKDEMKFYLEKNQIKYSLVNLENAYDKLERKMYILFIDKRTTGKTINLIRKYDPAAVISSTSTNFVERNDK